LSRRLQQVSVLFVDVAHSTELLARIGPEDADEVLGRALERFAQSRAAAWRAGAALHRRRAESRLRRGRPARGRG
jgi:class 3 adenylate cyclase